MGNQMTVQLNNGVEMPMAGIGAFLDTKLRTSFYEQADMVEKTLVRLNTGYMDQK